MENEIINKVASSGLTEFNLEDFYPKGERVVFDLKDFLFQGLILKEKDFREALKSFDWTTYKDKYVAVLCSADAIVPSWAFMLIAVYLEPYAKRVVFGNPDMLETVLYNDALSKLDIEKFRGEKIIIKGCSKYPVPESAYVEITRLLRPVARSIMYGEACSTVPLFKAKE
ncbi:MAG: DUF2480 family protein [Bacteroidia bacterium]